MSAEKIVPETEPVTDRGDEVVAPEPVKVELTDEDLAKIGRAPEKKAEAAEPKKEAEVAEKEPEKKVITIPKARFDEVNNKAKAKVAALESQLQAMQAKLDAAGAAPDVVAMEKELDTKSDEYGKLVADGELDKAKVVLQEISKLNRRIGLVEASALSTSHTQESKHMDSLEVLVNMFKDTFPVFDDAKPGEYKQEYVDYVARLQGSFETAGRSPAEALREAVEIAVAKFGLAPDGAAPAATAAKDEGATRKTAAIDKALKAAGAQPPSLDKVGEGSDKMGMAKIDVDSLSMDEFLALPESTLKRLRGDIV